VALARLDQSRSYVLAGAIDPEVQARMGPLPANLRVTGRLSHEELRALLWSSDVYVQLSWHETFGAAVAEAMACGCVPMVSDQGALREVVGPHGIVVPGADVLIALELLDNRPSQPPDRRALRQHVVEQFSPEARLSALHRALEINPGG
jgi:glycosyltransferase involved in cell wall biosynthesis